ncbi:MAG: PD40 domain-containing protein [Acidobacteria bacterium]|nr:PD40 domain-containing protein [Acidobacteriota bacterium]
MSDACAEFCARWRGSDLAEGARLLRSVLPPRVPGALQLVLARAQGELDVPRFATPEEFRAAVRRFMLHSTSLVDISDVRRARREARITLERLAHDTALPRYVLRQLEWGDFRRWHHEGWTRRVCDAYATAAGLDPARVLAIVEAERARQIDAPDAALAPAVPRARRRAGRLAAAAAVFTAGVIAGGLAVDRLHSTPVAPPRRAATAIPPPAPGSTASDVAPRGASGETDLPVRESSAPVPAGAVPVQPRPSPPEASADNTARRQPEPSRSLRKASVTGLPSFSPAFSSAGSAVFYHRDEGAGTALLKAETDASTGDLRVISLLQDGARNYHVKPSPDGSRIAFDSDRDGERGVYVANADGSEVRRVSGPGLAAVPSWSPDGTRLAFVRGEAATAGRVWNLWVLDLASNASVRLTSYRYGQPWGASWFPDGRRLAYSHEDRLTVLDLATGARRLYQSPRAGRVVRTPAVSPDGRHIAFQVLRDGAWLLDLTDGSMQRILADPTAEEFAWDATGRRLAFHSRRSGSWSVWIMSRPADPAS